MRQAEVDELLTKYFTQSIDKEGKKKLESWIRDSDQNTETFNALRMMWGERSENPELVNADEMVDDLWNRTVTEEKGGKQARLSWNYFLKVAAVLLLFITVPYILYRIIDHGGFKGSIEEQVSSLNKTNPPGMKTKLVLPDGSVVFLNSDSKLIYPERFPDTARIVELSGEAFFEVAHDQLRPFVVKTENTSTTALGTSFNIDTHHSEEEKIALFTGRVKVVGRESGDQIILLPGHMAVYNANENSMNRLEFSNFSIAGWKDGILVFESASFEEFVQKVHRWYGVEVRIVGNAPEDWKLTAHYEKETLENLLRNISFEKDFVYEIAKESLTLKFK